MAQGFHELGASLSFPGEELRNKYFREKPGFQTNPLFEQSLQQLLTGLNPAIQRKRLRRSFGNVGSNLGREQERALSGIRESYAQRGLQGAGFAARPETAVRSQFGETIAGLPAAFQQALDQRMQDARSQAMDFLLKIIQARLGITGANEQITARKNEGRITTKDLLQMGAQVVGGVGGGIGGALI